MRYIILSTFAKGGYSDPERGGGDVLKWINNLVRIYTVIVLSLILVYRNLSYRNTAVMGPAIVLECTHF